MKFSQASATEKCDSQCGAEFAAPVHRRYFRRSAAMACLLVLGLTACGGEPGEDIESPPDPVIETPVAGSPDDEPDAEEPDADETPEDVEPADPFDLDRILQVDVQMRDEDWAAMSADGRAYYQEIDAPCFPGYTWFTGTLTIAGETMEEVSIRKKGGWGSVSEDKPSVKLDFGKGEYDGRKLSGMRRFTLNNNVQDRLHIKQCLSYSVFADAGVHTPRCNFAQVTAQSEDLGIFTNVEPIKKPFLSYSFGNKSGNLYETQHAGAFIESRIAHFQKKTNEDDPDRSELMAVVEAMQVEDELLWDAMDQVINMDNFMTFAAMESLLGHADGFTGYQNNAYIYHNPDDDRLYFIPWGTDQTFRASYIIDRTQDSPVSIYLGSSLTQRLWQSEEFRERYDQRLLELLDTVWNEAEIKARATYMGELVGIPHSEIEGLHEFIDSRRPKALAEIAGEADRTGIWTVLPPTGSTPSECVLDDEFQLTADAMATSLSTWQ